MSPSLHPFLPWIACLAVTVAAAQAPADPAARHAARFSHDHHDPARLNEAAIGRIRQGDLATAAILLERAAHLAPHDARIRRNLGVLRAFRAGEAAGPEAIAPARTGPAIPPEPPAPWPAR